MFASYTLRSGLFALNLCRFRTLGKHSIIVRDGSHGSCKNAVCSNTSTCQSSQIQNSSSNAWSNYNQKDPKLRHVNVPSHGSRYRVGYLDAGPADGATVLAIHGSPGGACDFDIITRRLVEKHLRVITPSLPGNPLTKKLQKKSSFNYSTSHRAEFVLNFMEAINLKCVDVVIGHSLGGPPALSIAAKTDRAKAVALLNSVGHIIHRKVQPYWYVQLAAHGLETPLIRKIFRYIVQRAYEKLGFKVTDLEHLVAATICQARLEFKKIHNLAQIAHSSKLPVLSVWCQDDKLLEWEIPLAMAQVMGIEQSRTSFFDELGRIYQGPGLSEVFPARSLVFASGGHHAHVHHSRVVTKCVLDLIDLTKDR